VKRLLFGDPNKKRSGLEGFPKTLFELQGYTSGRGAVGTETKIKKSVIKEDNTEKKKR